MLLLALALTLAACTTDAPGPTTGAATTLPAASGATTLAADAPVVSDGVGTPGTSPQQPGAGDAEQIDCGEVAVSGSPPRAADGEGARTAASCFLKAVEACQGAVLTVQEGDSGVVRQFTVEPDRQCVVREALQPDPSSPPAVVDCQRATAAAGGILIAGCSHLGDFTLSP